MMAGQGTLLQHGRDGFHQKTHELDARLLVLHEILFYQGGAGHGGLHVGSDIGNTGGIIQ